MERKKPALVPLPEMIVQAEAGGMHTVCLSQMGKVSVWGGTAAGGAGGPGQLWDRGSESGLALPRPAGRSSSGNECGLHPMDHNNLGVPKDNSARRFSVPWLHTQPVAPSDPILTLLLSVCRSTPSAAMTRALLGATPQQTAQRPRRGWWSWRRRWCRSLRGTVTRLRSQRMAGFSSGALSGYGGSSGAGRSVGGRGFCDSRLHVSPPRITTG